MLPHLLMGLDRVKQLYEFGIVKKPSLHYGLDALLLFHKLYHRLNSLNIILFKHHHIFILFKIICIVAFTLGNLEYIILVTQLIFIQP